MPATLRFGCAMVTEREDGHHWGSHGRTVSPPPRLRVVVARPWPRRVLHSTHTPMLLDDAVPRYHTTSVVDAWGEATITEKAICAGCAELPAPRLTCSVPRPLTPWSALMASAMSPNAAAL